jgi:phosphopantetheinyl transferase
VSLFYQHTINQTTKLGIWHIEEQESFFLNEVPLQQSITHPHKRLQHLAGRYLLKYLFPDFPHDEILIADTRKPYLPGEQYHFSISHCGDYAAAIVSSTHRIGIDIEIPSVKVQRISHKFIHGNEQQWLNESPVIDHRLAINQIKSGDHLPWTDMQLQTANYKLQTILWSAKEAIFKWYSLGEVDFKEHIQLCGSIFNNEDESFILPFRFQKNNIQYLNITSKIFETLVLSWVISVAH